MRNAALLRNSAIAGAFLSLSLLATGIFGAAQYRCASAYEDTVRIVILYNSVQGDNCGAGSQPVGNLTRDEIVAALDTTRCHNVRVLPSTSTSWANILNLWPGKMPHTIIHSNAGWYTANGSLLQGVFDSAVANHIGVVEVGDDAAGLATTTFGFTGVTNVPAPMYDATIGAQDPRSATQYCCDSLWIGLFRANDDPLKTHDLLNVGQLAYPYSGVGANTAGGVISNAIDSILRPGSGITPVLNFKRYGAGRCQEDADQYTAQKPTTPLGYQMGEAVSRGIFYGDPNSFYVLSVIQDTVATVNGPVVRRGIALSFQPQFLANQAAEQQITYDACMFTTRTYTLDVPQKFVLIHPDTMRAGDTIPLIAKLLNRKGEIIYDTSIARHVFWTMDPDSQRQGDRFLTNIGDTVRYTATSAWRHVGIIATYYFNSGISIDTTVWIWVKAGAVDHMLIEASSQPQTVSPNVDNPLGGATKTISFTGTLTLDSGWSVLRDRFGNYVSFSTHTLWGSTDTSIAKVVNGNRLIGEGVFSKTGTKQGLCKIGCRDSTNSKVDTILVNVDNTVRNGLRIMRYSIAQGGLVAITGDTVAMDDSSTIYVQGHRADGLDPNKNGGWEDVSGNWTMSATLHTSRVPPQNQNSWTFRPTDTGTGTISVSLPGSSVQAVTIPALFIPGKPNLIALYPAAGAPSLSNAVWPADPIIADSMVAGTTYTKIYAKLFYNNIWLPKYQDSGNLAQLITWSRDPADNEDTLTKPNNYYTGLWSTRAYRNVRVTATWNGHTASMLIRIKPSAPTHLVIEASVPPTDSANDQPLASISLGASQVAASAYAILRDAFGNFVAYSTSNHWRTTDTNIIYADTGAESVGQGLVFRHANSGSADLIDSNFTYHFCDSVRVDLSNIYYDTLWIYTIDANLNKIYHRTDTVVIQNDSQSIFYAEGWRSDNTGRDRVPVTWSMSSGLKTKTNPPASVDNWIVQPDSIGKGYIKIARTDNGKTWTDSVWVRFTPGKPKTMVLYRHPGIPSPSDLFPPTDTLTSESTDTLVAKLFDRNGQWLPHYDTLLFSQPVLVWTILKLSGPGPAESVLGATTGHITTYKPRIAYSTYRITVRFTLGSTFITDSAFIYVGPGNATQLVIEPGVIQPHVTPDNLLIGDHPIDTVRLGAADSVYSNIYAVLRDRDSNFVSMSTSTIWNSFNTAVVTARENIAQVGQGLITRVGTTGMTTKVTALNRLNLNLYDTVNVKLDSIPYSALRIVVRDLNPILALTMTTDADTAMQVQANRAGNWESAQANWQFIGTTAPMSATNVHEWRFAPVNVDSGIIIVSLGSSLKDTITVKIGPGTPASVVLYGSENAPGSGNLPLAGPPQLIPCTAGTPFPMAAKMFDRRGVYLPQYDLTVAFGGNFSWSAVSQRGSMNAFLDQPNTGALQHFNSPRAGDTVSVIVTYFVSAQVTPRDTVRLVINPGTATHMVLERNPNNTNTPNPIDTLIIQGAQQTNSVYAILRDANQNFVAFDNITVFGSTDTSKVGVSVQQLGTYNCQLRASRNDSTGSATIFAADDKNYRDSCAVKLLAYVFDSLRIIAGIDSLPHRHGVLSLSNNDSTVLRVQGKRSDREAATDTGAWVNVQATWEIAPNLSAVLPGSGRRDSTFTLSPTDTGTGWIRVTLNDDATTKPDTLRLNCTAGDPVAASIQIITPTDSLIAGRPILAVVTITDKDNNPVRKPVTYDSAFYHDTLGRGDTLPLVGDTLRKRLEPFLVVDNTTIFLDLSPAGHGRETFTNGVDTVSFTLFYAASDSTHQITATLRGNALPLVAATVPFILHPSAITLLRLEPPVGAPYRDTLNLNRNDTLTLISRGYDHYGNLTGDMGSKWSVTDGLPPPTDTTHIRASAIYIANQALHDTSGFLFARYSGTVTLADSVFLFVKGPPVELARAVTRDMNGNGLLDHIELHFTRALRLPNTTTFTSGISISYGTTLFYLDSLIGAGTKTDSIWVVAIKETVGATDPQTGWTPSVTIPDWTDINLAGNGNAALPADDGAGPVIWKVTKLWVSSTVHDSDLVTVTFSEPVKLNGSAIQPNNAPNRLFNVWGKADLDDSTYRNPATLAGITSLYSVNDTQAVIRMSNDSNLTEKQYFNINIDTVNFVIADNASNHAGGNNQKVRVLVTGSPTAPLVSTPNPMRPVGAGNNSGSFTLINEPNYQSRSLDYGTIFSFGVPLYQTMLRDVGIQATIKVYDVLGNLVTAATNDQFVRYDVGTNAFAFDGGNKGWTPMQVSGNIAHVYWNGVNGHGMTIAPGIYRVVVDLHYADQGSGNANQFKDQRRIANLGVKR